MADWYGDLVTFIDEDNKDGILSVLQRLPNIPGAIERLGKNCADLVLASCKNGYVDVLQFMTEHGININNTDAKESPIQVACESNQVDVLDILLALEVSILPDNVQVWEEASPLYIASRCGYRDIVCKLIQKDPSLINTDEVRSCLLYAACLGGNIQVVKMWLSPGLDINHPIQLVKRFTQCEQLTPLYAACAGGNIDLVKFLMHSCGDLHFTASVCNAYPDLIGEVMRDYFVSDSSEDDDLFQMITGHLQNKHLYVLHPSWLSFVTLVELNISNNSITELPDCVPFKFQNLRVLNASRNMLKRLSYACDEGDVDDDSVCPSLEEVDISYNNLEYVCRELFESCALKHLDLSHNKLEYLSKSVLHQADPPQDSISTLNRQSLIQERHWMCSPLRKLDVSHNALVMLPLEIQVCTQLVQIIANNNRLSTFPQPWNCPLEILDLSHNQLTRFPVNTEVYWSGSLRILNISCNHLDEINEGIVKLNVLTDLVASHNIIDRLPGPEVWECGHLYILNLKHNKLGIPLESPTKKNMVLPWEKKRSYSIGDSRQLHFPQSLAYCLGELLLADNNLDCVPPSVCDLTNLEVLDISDNPLIKTLPMALGRLRNCGMLKLRGCNVHADYLSVPCHKAKEILSQLLEKLLDSQPYNKLKAVVLGKKDKGKTSLVNILANKKKQSLRERKSIEREEVTLVKKTFSIKNRLEIHLNVWDISGDEVYTQIHPSVFTPLTLYILVWDFWSVTEELDEIEKWINNIQVSTTRFCVVLVGTFIDRLMPLKANTIQVVRDKLIERFGDNTPRLCPVSCINNEGIEQLRICLYETALNMTLPGRNKHPVIGRKIPNSYCLMEKLIVEEQKKLEAEKKPLYLTHSQFIEIVESVPTKHKDLLSTEETTALTKFLVEAGYLLHFTDQLGGLDTLYFLDPAWLCDILVHVIISPNGKRLLRQGRGKISRKDAELSYKESNKFPNEFVDQYIELLERFEIAASISQSKYLYFPCQLPMQPPIIESADDCTGAKCIRRLYRMSECPSGFWMRLVTRMMMRVDQFSRKDWPIRLSKRYMSMRLGNCVKKEPTGSGSFYGLQIKSPTKTFCRELIHVSHEDGSFCVEPASFSGSDRLTDLQSGVLITEVSKSGTFSIMGIIVDEIEDIIQDFYPGLLEPELMMVSNRLERYALCSTCYQGLPLPNDVSHFTMEHCARQLINGSSLTCPKGIKHELNVLVPDLLMKELPDSYFMDVDKLDLVETTENCLGTGVTGLVFKAKYKEKAVAIKVYRSDIRNKLPVGRFASVDSNGGDSGTATLSTDESLSEEEELYVNVSNVKTSQIDADEAESMKALRAIKEMRQEVAITSRLHHPCIISLVGLAFRPKLMMALELAPLGSLRNILDRQMQVRPVFNRYRNRDELFPPLFEKELIFKFVYQIAKGLEYLHSNSIVYKDLKSDNILTISDDLSAPVNLKLSDYGISKYIWSGRSVGLAGTPGYQAPEILDGRSYDEKVDIFAFSMVIYEIMTGRRPYAEYKNMSQITKAMKTEGKRPNLKDFNVLTRFPYVESLMKKSWNNSALLRPSASDIVSKHSMYNLQFLAQSWDVDFPGNQTLSPTCVLGHSESDSQSLLCVWDGCDCNRRFSILDPVWSSLRVAGQKFYGPQVLCMAKVGKHIWVGTQENSVVVYTRSGTGSIDEIWSLKQTGRPVQLLAVENQKGVESQTGYNIYVALDNGCLREFRTVMANRKPNNAIMRNRVKKISVHTDRSIVLKSQTIYCIAYSKTQQELWTSSKRYINIVSCSHFTVKERINLTTLLRMCQIHPRLCVSQMVSSDSQMFCMLAYSPYILEFDADTYTCITLLDFRCEHVISKCVATEMKFTQTDHDVYHAITTEDNLSDDIDDSDEDSDDKSEEAGTFASNNYCNQASYSRNRKQSMETQSTGASSELNSEIFGEPPQIPPRRTDGRLPSIEELTAPTRPCTRAPIVPPKPHRPRQPSEPPSLPPKGTTLQSDISGLSRKKIGKQKSLSLPNMSRHSGHAIELTSVLIVKNLLWVGRGCGDICIVNTHRPVPTVPDRFGKVLADMYSLNNRDQGGKTVQSVRLVKTGKHIASAYTLHDGIHAMVQIAFWDSYGVEDVQRVEGYWEHILAAEKLLLRGS